MQPRTVSRIDSGITSLRHTIQSGRGTERGRGKGGAAVHLDPCRRRCSVLPPRFGRARLAGLRGKSVQGRAPRLSYRGRFCHLPQGALRRRTRCADCRSTSARGKRLPASGGQGARRAATLEVLTAAARARSRRSWQNKRGGCSPENSLLTCTSCDDRLLPAQLDTCRGSKGLRAAMQNKSALFQIGVAEAMQQAQFGRRSRPSAPEYYLSSRKKNNETT